jgi:hypothetical protein
VRFEPEVGGVMVEEDAEVAEPVLVLDLASADDLGAQRDRPWLVLRD